MCYDFRVIPPKYTLRMQGGLSCLHSEMRMDECMFVTPKQAAELSVQAGMMMAEAQMVIAMRLWGMAGFWNTNPEENLRMVQEKAEAALQSATRAGAAMMAGQGTAAVAMAALKPVRSRTRANLKRLQKSGPNLPL